MRKLCLMLIMLLGASYLASGQVTTASMGGKVTDSQGESVTGAMVSAVHQPSGTTYVGVTNQDGRYTIQGMRTGGPYRVDISYLGAETMAYTDITLQLGSMYVLDSQMGDMTTELETVIVTAVGSRFANEKTGPSTNISNTQMNLMPSINRSIEDMARLSPYANGMSFAGGDGRSSNFTVDGANFNNNFGLNDGLPGGGNPISLDAIEEVQVVIAPFDVRQTNFIGGGINAITKSGTNTFKGSAYAYFRNQDMRGNKIDGKELSDRIKDSRTVYGATLGGPIIKNKLFFFGNVEYEKTPGQAVRWRASKDGVSDNQTISRTTEDDLQAVKDHLMEKYGYDTGSYTDFPADESNLKYLLRLDWNINQNHKFSIRYNHTKNTAWNAPNATSNDSNPRSPNNAGRVSSYSMSYANSMYSTDNKVSSVAGELNSRFGSKFSNQLLVTYSNIADERGSTSSPFPFIDIMDGDLEGSDPNAPTSYIAAGYELFTWNNGVKNKVTTITDNFTAYLGRHTLTAGISYEHQFADNIYMREGTGYYRYASLSDFLEERAPIDVAYTYGANGVKRPANAVDFDQIGFYVQDEWDINPSFKLTAGIRGDVLSFRDNLMRNNALYALDFGGRKFDTGSWPKARLNLSPRVGFTWDVNKDKRLVVRGGTGLFMGRLPLVFLTNMPTNSGMTQVTDGTHTSFVREGSGYVYQYNPELEVFAGGMATTVEEIMERLGESNMISPDDGTVRDGIASVASDFKMPQVWKTALAVDYMVPVDFPFTITAEAMYTKNINAIMLDNYAVRSRESGNWERFSGPDDRVRYPENMYYDSRVKNAQVLINTDEGYGYTLNLTLNAEPVRNLRLMAAYTHTEMKEVSGMPGNAANSVWTGMQTVNGPNLAVAQRSQYVVPHQVIASATYRIPYAKDHMASTFSLFYRGFSPSGYSYMYTNDLNGDGVGNDLIYIPKEKGEVEFTTQADEDAFFKYMEQDKYLSKHKGEYAESYAARAPFVHRFDFRFMQDFSIMTGRQKNTLQLSLDILNVGNLLNSKWGVMQNMGGSNSGRILTRDRVENNVPVFSMYKDDDGNYPTKTFQLDRYYTQCWSIQIGLRYMFN